MKAIKNNRFLSFCIVATALLCSCSKEPVESFAGGDPTSPILPGAAVAATVETKADLSGAVTTTSFPANTTKVFAVVGYKGTAAPTNNWSSPYINGVIVNSNASGVLSFATPQYYPANGDKVFFYAYSPASGTYTAGNGATTPKVAWTINGTQDIMGAKVTTGIAKAATGTQSQPVFAFTHKLKQVKFKVVKDASFENDIKLTSLLIIGAKTSATIDVSTGNVTWASTTGNLTVYSNSTGQTITTSAASVGSPMMFEPGTSFKVRAIAGGQQYADVTVTLSGANAGTAGYSHEVTLKFMRNVITPTATISEWTTTGTGPTADIEVEEEQDILYITDITLNSSSSHTVPRAGGTFTLVAQTNTTPTSNISWLVKMRDNYQVGSSTDYADFRTATINVAQCAAWGAEFDLDLYWSYDGSPYRKYDGPYTLNQPGWTITSAEFSSGVYQNNAKLTHSLAGSRKLNITGYDSNGPAFYLRCDATNKTLGPYKSSNPSVTFDKNGTNANLEYKIMAYNQYNQLVDLGLSPLTQSKNSPIPSTSIKTSGNRHMYVNTSLTTWYNGVTTYCEGIGMKTPNNYTNLSVNDVKAAFPNIDWTMGYFSATPWTDGFYYYIYLDGSSWKKTPMSTAQYKTHYRLCFYDF